MSEPIAPAMTPEEWEDGGPGDVPGFVRDSHAALLSYCVRVTTTTDDGTDVEGSDRHALAALCLHGQPFGFTREDIQLLTWSDRHTVFGSEADKKITAARNNLAARIAALLPPEKT